MVHISPPNDDEILMRGTVRLVARKPGAGIHPPGFGRVVAVVNPGWQVAPAAGTLRNP